MFNFSLYDMMKEENEKFKMERTKLHEIAMNVLFEYVTHEYNTCDDIDSLINGYNYFPENMTIESALTDLSTAASIGGTSLLIVVGVALETYKQLEGSLLSRNYKKGYSRR